MSMAEKPTLTDADEQSRNRRADVLEGTAGAGSQEEPIQNVSGHCERDGGPVGERRVIRDAAEAVDWLMGLETPARPLPSAWKDSAWCEHWREKRLGVAKLLSTDSRVIDAVLDVLDRFQRGSPSEANSRENLPRVVERICEVTDGLRSDVERLTSALQTLTEERDRLLAEHAKTVEELQPGRWRTFRNSCPRTFPNIPMTPEECSCVDCVEIHNERDANRLRVEHRAWREWASFVYGAPIMGSLSETP